MTSTIQPVDTTVNLLQSLLWQYNEALRLQGLLEAKQAWYDENQTVFWDDWYRDVFDLRTANEFGLSVWAIILGLPLTVNVNPSPPTQEAWGFGQYRKNFEHGNFFVDADTGVTLMPEQARIVLRMRYFQLTCAGCLPEINRFMKYLFADYGPVYVTDGLDMTCFYTFGFDLPANLRFVLDRYDILPCPAGVGVGYVVTP